MTGSDLIVLTPWTLFTVGLAVVCVLLVRSTRGAGSRRSFWARRAHRHHDPQEARCPENNEPARPR